MISSAVGRVEPGGRGRPRAGDPGHPPRRDARRDHAAEAGDRGRRNPRQDDDDLADGMVLTEAGFDPTIVVGGRVRILGTNARLGKGDFLVAEADEYDRSFLELTPDVAVITNVEADHLDCYRDLADILDAFAHVRQPRSVLRLRRRVPGRSRRRRSLLPRVEKRVVTYGESPQAHLSRAGHPPGGVGDAPSRCWDAEQGCSGRCGCLFPAGTTSPTRSRRSRWAASCSIPFATIARALAGFTGVVRRFEKKGSGAACSSWTTTRTIPPRSQPRSPRRARSIPERRLVALFQPHLYSRTRDFAADFGRALLRRRRRRGDRRLPVAGEAAARGHGPAGRPRPRARRATGSWSILLIRKELANGWSDSSARATSC